MSASPLLAQERNIRIAGALLMLSPLGNLLLSIWSFNIPNKWTSEFFWQVVNTSSPGHWYLKGACIIVGAWMAFTAKRSSWLFALIVLGLYIGYGIINFKAQKNMSGVFTPTLSLLSNIGFFAFIYFVEFQHAGLLLIEEQRKKLKANVTQPKRIPDFSPTESPQESAGQVTAINFDTLKPLEPVFQFDLTRLEGIILDFEGVGPWAIIERATGNEIYLRSEGEAPQDISVKPVEIVINETQALEFQLLKSEEKIFVFKFQRLKELQPPMSQPKAAA